MPLTPEQKAEIDRLRAEQMPTRRATVPALEEILYEPLPVLDHGFVRVIDYMGDDAAVVQAARVSYGKGTKRVSEDRGLIHYLMRHRHTTPFEMCEIKYHVKLPIFVARQWIRHRTANVNEYSARYSILDNEFYVPAPEQLAAQSKSNRQGRGEVLAGAEAARVLDLLREDAERAYRGYAEMLNEDEAGGVRRCRAPGARARARAHEPVAQFLYAVVLEDRPAQSAQFPQPARRRPCAIRDPRLCRGDDRHARRWVPLTAEAFRQYRLGGAQLSERGARRGAPPRRRRGGDAGGERHEQARMGRADGGARAQKLVEQLSGTGPIIVAPAQAGAQSNRTSLVLDPRFRGECEDDDRSARYLP